MAVGDPHLRSAGPIMRISATVGRWYLVVGILGSADGWGDRKGILIHDLYGWHFE